MRALTLLIRNIEDFQFSGGNDRFAALGAFLARCQTNWVANGSTTGWLCDRFGIQRQHDWPAGAILARAHGADNGAKYWICAQPVHLAVDRDDLILQPRSQLRLSEQESRTLFALLEPHFAEHELETKHIGTGLWCLGSKRIQDLTTTEIELAEGHSVDRLQPSGKDASWWQRLIVEAQMYLHEQPLNLAREDRDDPPINSLWLWGGGSVPPIPKRFDTMCANDPLLHATAALSQAQLIEMPNNALDAIAEGELLLECTIASDGGPGKSLSDLETEWFAPAWGALGGGHLDQLTLVLPLPHALVTCRCDRKARRRFWKRPQALRTFLSQFQIHGHAGS